MANKATNTVKKIKAYIFLKDVFFIAITAYGGPAMHLALYQKRLVEEKKYLTTDELLELYSLAQMLPGPSSTQTLTSIGYKFGGPSLAFLTLLIWVFPAFLLLTLSAVFIGLFEEQALIYLRYVTPVAVAFVTVAGFKMIKKSISSNQGYLLACLKNESFLAWVGASKLGSVFIYILVSTIGMKMDLTLIFDNLGLMAIGLIWMSIHAILLIVVAKLIKAPYFFLAIGSQANVGGARLCNG